MYHPQTIRLLLLLEAEPFIIAGLTRIDVKFAQRADPFSGGLILAGRPQHPLFSALVKSARYNRGRTLIEHL